MVWRQKLRRKKKKESAIKLSIADFRKLRKIKIRSDSATLGDIFSDRSLDEINQIHRMNILDYLQYLRRRFKNQTLEVLDEGARGGGLAKELQEKANKEFGPNAARVIAADIRNFTASGVQNVAAEELVKRFGKDRFHLIISTHGGGSYTQFEKIKVLSNIVAALKPGGMATIAMRLQIAERPVLEKLQKLWPNISIKYKGYENDGVLLKIQKN